ncbi:MAG: histidine kinase [Taibaiella sp.]|nr:histidine kinase [Taibaiella sp.]
MGKQGKLYLYSALFISIVVNSPKFAALDSTSVVARLWKFNAYELAFQSALCFCYCLGTFYYNHNRYRLLFRRPWHMNVQGRIILVNAIGFAMLGFAGLLVHNWFFSRGLMPGSGYFFRQLLCLFLMAVEMRIFLLMGEAKDREIENEHLQSAYLQAQLHVLKGQLNPHFLYNALSSLSGIVSEDPAKARKYISHMSRFFRYSLTERPGDMVTLADELAAAGAYAEVMKMRHEDGLHIDFRIGASGATRRLPHMSLQPLLENVLKHNAVSSAMPLYIYASDEPGFLVLRNNLQPLATPEPGSGVGLANLSKRCKILMGRELQIERTATEFIVKIPMA